MVVGIDDAARAVADDNDDDDDDDEKRSLSSIICFVVLFLTTFVSVCLGGMSLSCFCVCFGCFQKIVSCARQ